MNFENESWSQHLPDKSLAVCQDNLNEFYQTMLERQLIWKRRFIDKKERPWTTDEFFRDRKFTNVYRVLDKNSMWEVENILLDDTLELKNLIWKLMFFRLFNNPPTFTYVPEANNNSFSLFGNEDEEFEFTSAKWKNGIPDYDEYDADEYLAYLKHLRSVGINPFTSAYLISSIGDRDTHFCKTVLPDFHNRIDEMIEFCQKAKSAEEIFKYLKTFTNVADFMAFQLFNDLTYVDKFTKYHLMDVNENSATTIGPGSDLGLRLIFPSTTTNEEKLNKLTELRDNAADWFSKNAYEPFPYLHFNKEIKQFYISDEPSITLCEIEQWLCEYAKYFKMKIGDGKQRNHFEPVTTGFKTV